MPVPQIDKETPFKNISINIPKLYMIKIDYLIDIGRGVSRSEIIREALRDYFLNEIAYAEFMGYFFDPENLKDICIARQSKKKVKTRKKVILPDYIRVPKEGEKPLETVEEYLSRTKKEVLREA
jgi:hypothetical protein